MQWYLKVVKNYTGFDGRARRTEYWMFVLVHIVIVVVLNLISTALYMLYSLATLIPIIAVGIRRMHDTNHSGWWLLFPIVNLVFGFTEGDTGDNQYGADPKAVEAV